MDAPKIEIDLDDSNQPIIRQNRRQQIDDSLFIRVMRKKYNCFISLILLITSLSQMIYIIISNHGLLNLITDSPPNCNYTSPK